MKNTVLTIHLIIFLVAGVPLISQAEKANIKVMPQGEKAADAKSPKGKASLKIGSVSKDAVSIDLTNSVPVRGVQFTAEGVKLREVRTTSRTAGFIAKFNEKNGVVILVSSSDNAIAAGNGAIAELICDKPDAAQLSGIKIVGLNKEPL